MFYTLYRAGAKESEFYRGGTWYCFTKLCAEHYQASKRMRIRKGIEIPLHSILVEINNPLYIDTLNLHEGDYPFLARIYLVNHIQIIPSNIERIRKILDDILDFMLDTYGFGEDEEAYYASVEFDIAMDGGRLGYDAIIFTNGNENLQTFVFDEDLVKKKTRKGL